jgi:hypothetical protein
LLEEEEESLLGCGVCAFSCIFSFIFLSVILPGPSKPEAKKFIGGMAVAG